ncbi:hypothetical protein [Agrococcus jejuensis]|uniref:Uncharacterized protein n=1 Tax=Agrococcus jejuensis TaxID=399736 RepID=A0A1G8H4I7_9MICO|nr:hypothetical protein [Agrococcus jejuensis]SDI01523.1 hypothetical protein SAMN04489720_3210 [Agrococcus jejuensis]
MAGFVESMAAKRLQRQIWRRSHALMPSIELPMPPWGPEVPQDLVDIAADVLVLDASLAGSRTWQLDEVGAGFRREALANAQSIHERCAAQGLTTTADAVRFVQSSLRAWETIALR